MANIRPRPSTAIDSTQSGIRATRTGGAASAGPHRAAAYAGPAAGTAVAAASTAAASAVPGGPRHAVRSLLVSLIVPLHGRTVRP
ncbi:hypothetical protein [Streptomyces sp. NPDC059564]|uniref:hypothetical protein n=1 Tax=Streptomyces sp. NPDC059564 TaxID=3346865 RepID=UPI0036B31496